MIFSISLAFTIFSFLVWTFLGIIHSVTWLWQKWEKFTNLSPLIHLLIGVFAFFMALINLILLVYKGF